MKIEFKISFDNDLKNQNKDNIKRVFEKINIMKNISNINDLNNIKKLKGYKNYYRIRIGEYRLGFKIENNIIILERFLHRKDIYKNFPK